MSVFGEKYFAFDKVFLNHALFGVSLLYYLTIDLKKEMEYVHNVDTVKRIYIP